MDAESAIQVNVQPKASAWKWLLRVPYADPEQARLGRFAAGASAVMGVVAALVGVAALLAPTLKLSMPAAFAGAILFFAAYGLNRAGYYKIAAWLALGTFIAVPYASLLMVGRNIAVLMLVAAASAVGILYVRALFPANRLGWSVGGALLVLYLILPSVYPAYRLGDAAVAAASIVVIGLASAVYAAHRDSMQDDRSAQATEVPAPVVELQKANARLEQQITDLNIEIQATVDEFVLANQAAEDARKEAERANYVKSAFLASMSHELRTPLNAVINLTRFVVDGDLGPLNGQQKETLGEVIDSGKHLLNLINDVLDMSKIESGSLNLFVEDDVDLAAILNTVSVTARGLLADKPVELTLDIAEDLPLLRVDRQRILQVLLNITSNACKFTRQGEIKLCARRSGDDVVISVQDTGPGIAAADHALVFEAFKQTDAGLRHGGGTGLGMPISRNLVNAHGGRLWLESELGKGATFFVSLPVKSQKLVPMFSATEGGKR